MYRYYLYITNNNKCNTCFNTECSSPKNLRKTHRTNIRKRLLQIKNPLQNV